MLGPKAEIPQVVEALQARGSDQNDLFEAARQFRGDKVFLRASIELSNHCRQNCAYCGMRRGNLDLERFRITGDALSRLVDQAIAVPEVDFVHFSFGEDTKYPIDDLVGEMRKLFGSGKTVSLVLGELPTTTYKKLFDAAEGQDIRYTIKMETTDPQLFRTIKPGHEFPRRLAKLGEVKDIGFKPCTGIIVGLPGQTAESIAKDLIFLTSYPGLDNISASTFTPSPGSPFEYQPRGDDNITTNFLALARLFTQNSGITIPASSSLEGSTQQAALKNFANLVSIHLIPDEYRDKYLIYNGPNRNIQKIDRMRKIIDNLGLRFNRG